MIVTFTGNTSLDQILFVPTLARGDTVRASRTYESMGGKGTDVSWILGKLGVPSLALGFIAGRNGERITKMLHERGVETDFVVVGGESRRNVVIIDQDGGGQVTYTAPTLHVEERHVRAPAALPSRSGAGHLCRPRWHPARRAAPFTLYRSYQHGPCSGRARRL